jgi:hypothetical protein
MAQDLNTTKTLMLTEAAKEGGWTTKNLDHNQPLNNPFGVNKINSKGQASGILRIRRSTQRLIIGKEGSAIVFEALRLLMILLTGWKTRPKANLTTPTSRGIRRLSRACTTRWSST